MSFLDQITPVILTYNEEANLGRCLDGLAWAKTIVVVDSFSTDATQRLCAADPRIRFVQRAFDNHAAQWNFAKDDTGIETPWVLALDCDYMIPQDLQAEIAALRDSGPDAYWVRFRYAVMGRVLRSGVYPPVQALYRRAAGHYVQDGHTQRLVVSGESGSLNATAIHDDRKSLARWFASQMRYAELEAEKLSQDAGGYKAWLRRRTPFAPLAMGAYCLLVRGGLLEGPEGWTYALQRMLAEAMIGVALLDRQLRSRPGID